jgi:hypothetical protein
MEAWGSIKSAGVELALEALVVGVAARTPVQTKRAQEELVLLGKETMAQRACR